MTNVWPWWEKSKATGKPAEFLCPRSVWNQNFPGAAHEHNLLDIDFKKIEL